MIRARTSIEAVSSEKNFPDRVNVPNLKICGLTDLLNLFSHCHIFIEKYTQVSSRMCGLNFCVSNLNMVVLNS